MVACLAALALISFGGCGGNAPCGPTPDQFVSVKVFFYVAERSGPPTEGDLDAVDHYELGPQRTRVLFGKARALDSRPFYFDKGGSDYCVAKLKNGRTCVVALSRNRAFKVEGGGYYAFDRQGDQEYMAILLAAIVRVKEMGQDRRSLTHAGQLDTAGPQPKVIGEKYGYVDEMGEMAIAPMFDDAWPFSDGLAPVRVGDADTGKWGYIDATGAWVIQPRFAGAWFFSGGMAAVTTDDFFTGDLGYINRQGDMVIAPRFERAGIFLGGRAWVQLRGDSQPHRIDANGVIQERHSNHGVSAQRE
jgi:hypothetical protein